MEEPIDKPMEEPMNEPIDNKNSDVQKTTPQEATSLDSAEMTLETIRAEYHHTMERSEKLDTKVSLLLTAVSFIFAFSTGDLINLKNIQMPSSTLEIVLLVLYIILTLAVFAGYIYMFCLLVPLLKGTAMHHLEPLDLFEGDVFALDQKTAARTIGTLYTKALTENNITLENRFQQFNKCAGILIPIIIATILDAIVGKLL